uniref:Conotoxin-like unassigned superfamily 08 n=1 Tax=Conus ermineus TaxID=55423 RepID=A0A346CIQ7_CONER|nr:conotoxin-like precursor unassigned superfamily 08 [Conus ermineus]
MMLFMFAAIIFTMASTTVIEDMCENGGQSVCAWKGMGEMCICPDPYSCVQSDAYKAEVTLVNRTETFYTCQQISDFSLCAASDPAMQGQLQQLNCRCSNGIYVLGVGAIVCG